MILHTVVVSHERLELLQRTIASYVATVSVPHTLLVVDNASGPDVREWLAEERHKMFEVLLLDENRYPGPATNLGFSIAPEASTHFHRSDSDMEYLPDWCDEVAEQFDADPLLGQLGLRTDEEELHAEWNVGGTAVFRRELWDDGIRYDERPWTETHGLTEDYWMSLEVAKRGWRWARVTRPCVVHTATGDLEDPYYQRSYGVRGIV